MIYSFPQCRKTGRISKATLTFSFWEKNQDLKVICILFNNYLTSKNDRFPHRN